MEKKEILLQSAKELFLEKGIENSSVREITTKANVAKGTFYLYFKDKNDLIWQLLDEVLADLKCDAIAYANLQMDEKRWVYHFFYAITNLCITQADRLFLIEKNLKAMDVHRFLISRKKEDSLVLVHLLENGYEKKDAIIRTVLAVRFIINTCYEAKLYGLPAQIEELRPYILQVVENLFNGGKIDGNI